MNLKRSRIKFALKTGMVPNFKFNYMNDGENEKSNGACNYCMINGKYKPDSMNHVLTCYDYADLRQKYNTSDESEIVDYFIKIVEERNDLKVA